MQSYYVQFAPFFIGVEFNFSFTADMKSLKLLVGLGHMTEDSMVIGRCTLPDLSGLSETQPYEE